LPIHFEVIHQILPTIAEADVADRTPGETATACHKQMNVLALCVHQFVITELSARPRVTGAKTAQVRRQQRVKAQLAA
jgi:hypothetical protein